jgi:hypothetical protein
MPATSPVRLILLDFISLIIFGGACKALLMSEYHGGGGGVKFVPGHILFTSALRAPV